MIEKEELRWALRDFKKVFILERKQELIKTLITAGKDMIRSM